MLVMAAPNIIQYPNHGPIVSPIAAAVIVAVVIVLWIERRGREDGLV